MAKRYYGNKRSDMITQPMNNRANMPQEVMMKDYPDLPCGQPEGYNDTRMGAESQMHSDIKGINRRDKEGLW